MDPQQRKLLEHTHKALENGKHGLELIRGGVADTQKPISWYTTGTLYGFKDVRLHWRFYKRLAAR